MWQQLKIQVESEKAVKLEEKLLEAGAISISFLDAKDQPIFAEELGSVFLWQQTYILALFNHSTNLDSLISELNKVLSITNSNKLEIIEIQDQNWQEKWKKDFKPINFGKNLWICPSWDPPPDPSATNIILDPGLAFGSGNHITTSLCLKWLAQFLVEGSKVVDYGCGSGVLSIASAMLGASKIYAVDNDPQAITATIDNSLKNRLDKDTITTYLPEALPEIKADILLANILAKPLIDLAEHFSGKLRPGGHIVLSGILRDQTTLICDHYEKWFSIEKSIIEQDWALLTGTRKT